jgi:iron(III) transport system substrate-binding protein
MLRLVSLALAAALLLSACQSDAPDADAASDGPLIVYAGRSQSLVDALVERFESQSDVDVEVRYGSDAEMIALLAEEGDRSDADLFWANTTGALGAASSQGLLTPLPDSLTARPEAFVPSSGLWAPVTARFRTLAYNTDALAESDLPASVVDLPGQEALRGRIGWTPTYSSFQDFVTALRLTEGEEAAAEWLEGMRALEPKAYSSNTPMLQALAAGEIDAALTNHYYVLRVTQSDDDAPLATHFFEAGDVGNLALVTGAGVLETSDQTEAAHEFLSFLLSDEAERYAAEQVYEYPVVDLGTLPSYLKPFDEALRLSPEFDFEQLRDLEPTLVLLRDQEML